MLYKHSMTNKEYTDLVEKETYPQDPLVPLDAPFVDERGIIQNLTNCQVGAVALITSKKGTERSNHWHKNNNHYLFIVSGRVQYFERDLDGSNIIVKTYEQGQMFFTPPNKVHKTLFLEDTILISIGKFSKDHDSHESDLVREEF